ncbi:MAG: hypothetical protein JOZ81_08395 [Chloroflexi bacterium]|nr:hypothetical protein [Chloroflexota bacterium]
MSDLVLNANDARLIRSIIEREQDRVVLRLLGGADELVQPHLQRYLAETRDALAALTEPEGR